MWRHNDRTLRHCVNLILPRCWKWVHLVALSWVVLKSCRGSPNPSGRKIKKSTIFEWCWLIIMKYGETFDISDLLSKNLFLLQSGTAHLLFPSLSARNGSTLEQLPVVERSTFARSLMPEPAKQFFKCGFYWIQVLLGANHCTSNGGRWLGWYMANALFFPTPLCLFTINFFSWSKYMLAWYFLFLQHLGRFFFLFSGWMGLKSSLVIIKQNIRKRIGEITFEQAY